MLERLLLGSLDRPLLSVLSRPHLSVRLLSLLQLVGELSALSDVLSGTRAWEDEAAIRTSYTNLGFSIWKGVQIAVKVRPVSCHDIAGIWVAFFSRCRRYRC